MNAGNGISEHHDCSGDAAAFVLGALEATEAEAFRAHMASCVVCRDEVAALQRVADVLPLTAPQYSVPRGLRQRVLAAVRAEPIKGESPRPPSRIRLQRPALAGALAAVLAVIAIGLVALTSGGSNGVRVIPARVTAAAASAQLRLASGRAELIVRHFPPPPAGHIYEVWLQRGRGAPSPTSTLFSVTSAGAGNIGLSGSLNGVREVLVTPEPAGGSLAPTHAPVIVAQLS